MKQLLQLLGVILKDFASIILVLLRTICRAVISLCHYLWVMACKFMHWGWRKLKHAKETMPEKMEKGKEMMEATHQKLQQIHEQLPSRIEQATTATHQTLQHIKDEWPSQMAAAKEMAQKSGRVIANVSQRTVDSLHQGIANLGDTYERFKESIDVEDPQSNKTPIIKMYNESESDISAEAKPETVAEPSRVKLSVTPFKFQKKYLWGFLIVCILIGGISTAFKKTSSNTPAVNYPQSAPVEYFNSNPAPITPVPDSKHKSHEPERKKCSLCRGTGRYSSTGGYTLDQQRFGTCPSCNQNVDLNNHSCTCGRCNGNRYIYN